MEISGLGDVPLLRKDIKIRPFSDGSSPGSKFLVEVGASHFLVNAEMHSLLIALQECPTTLSELAENLTKLTGKVVSLDTLRTVLQSKTFASLFDDDLPQPRASTPFLLNFQVITAAPLQRITSRITWLFSWPFVSLSMAAFFIIQYLLISNSVSVMGSSRSWAGLLWLYLGIAIGGLLHETGHLTACARYGSSHGGIGFALYLIFPAFYADVKSAWRLPRRSRIVVDLGGIYFQCLFLILIGIAALLSQATVLYQLNVFTIILMLFTLNPALKSDGYWLLVDASGIYNLYPRTKALLRKLFRKDLTQSSLSVMTEDAKVIALIYSILVVLFSSLLIVFSCLITYRTIVRYPKKTMAVIHALSSTIPPDKEHMTLSAMLSSLAGDTFWLVVIGLTLFTFIRRLAAQRSTN